MYVFFLYLMRYLYLFLDDFYDIFFLENRAHIKSGKNTNIPPTREELLYFQGDFDGGLVLS